MAIKLVNKYPSPTQTYTLDGYTKSCLVTEERNGQNEVKLTYLRTGPSANRFKVGMCLEVPVHRGGDPNVDIVQYYDIYAVKKEKSWITVQAKHVFYRLDGYIVMPYTQLGSGGKWYLWDCVNAAFRRSSPQNENITGFTYGLVGENVTRSDKPFNIDRPVSLKTLLFEIMAYFDAELVMNNMHVGFAKNRGKDDGNVAEYGLNILDFKSSHTTDNAFNRVTAYIYQGLTQPDGSLKMDFYSKTVDKPNGANNTFKHYVTALVDVASKVDIQNWAAAKTQCDAIANEIAQDLSDAGYESIKVTIADVLSSTDRDSEEFKDVKEIAMCDMLHVKYAPFNYSGDLKIVKTIFEAKLDRFTTIELGTIAKDLSVNLSDIEGYAYQIKY